MTDAQTTAKSRKAKKSTAKKVAEQLDNANPLALIAGGVAIGLVAGALVPRSQTERDALKSVGKRLADGTKAAVAAAKETGKAELSAAALTKDAAREGARKILESAVGAAKSAK
jgi:hypothetical protein